MRKRTSYTKEYKQAAVELVLCQGRSISEVSKSLGIHENMIRKWKKEFESSGEDAFRGQGNWTVLEKENRQLRMENQRLKLEQEFLKRQRRTLRST